MFVPVWSGFLKANDANNTFRPRSKYATPLIAFEFDGSRMLFQS
jgi:hypothetical protein